MTGILQQIMSTMEQTRSVSVLDSVSMIGFAALLVLGVINCVLGYRLLRFWMMLFGFLIGGGIGLGVAYTMGIQEKYMYAVIMIGVGILLAVIAFLSYKVGIFYYRCRHRTGTWNLCFPSDNFSGIFSSACCLAWDLACLP